MEVLPNRIAALFLKNAQEGVLGWDTSMNCTFWSPAMEKITGISQEACIGKKVQDILPYLEKSGEINFLKKTLHGKSAQLENRVLLIPEKGCCIYYSVQYYPLRNSSGEISGGMGILQDTNKYTTVLQALKEAEEKYIQLVNNAPLPVAVFTQKEILFVNQTCLKLFGLEEETEMVGQSPLLFVGEENRNQARQNISDILSGRIQKPIRHVLRRADGSELDAEITYLAMPYLGKKAIQAIIRNITEEKKAYDELITHKRLLSEAQRLAKLGSYQFFLEDKSLIWSDEIYKILEVNKADFQPVLQTYLDFMEESDKKELLTLIEEMKEGNMQEASFSHKIFFSNGESKSLRFNGKPVFDQRGNLSSIVGSLQDISEQRKTEEELSQANQILSLHFENSPLGIVQLNNDLEVTGWSKQAQKILGWEAWEVLGKSLLSLKLIKGDFVEIVKGLKDKMTDSHFNYRKNKLQVYTKNGTIAFCEVFISGIVCQDGRLNSYFLLINDITTRQLTEQARSEVQLEERKRIAREIHDGVGQMLIAIKYQLAGLEDFLPADKQHKVQEIEGHMEQALEEVRATSRNMAPRSVAIMGLESSLRQMCDQIKKLTAIDLSFRYIGGEQEISHKIVNALYRIAQEATNNIIKHAHATRASIQVFQGRNFIELKVEDNGRGISGQKSEGMGLKNMEERAQLLGGRFQLHSQKETGTSLIVNIPIE